MAEGIRDKHTTIRDWTPMQVHNVIENIVDHLHPLIADSIDLEGLESLLREWGVS